ncbi:hypothetical protein ABW19_dt0202530 [Dactylella cylindrospora]|nr:hypothetical protein ABW19_dt0202530 [Dactylella cylindrospora]
MAPIMNDVETIRFLLLCIDKCDTKSINFEEIAADLGLNGHKAAYKRLWDLKTKLRKKVSEGETAPRTPSKVKKTRTPKTSPRKKRAPVKEFSDEEVEVQDSPQL